jgi:ribosomal protein S18 acetylase RimI-like enzyme
VAITIRSAVAADLPIVGELHVRSRTAAYEGIVPAAALDAVSGPAMASWWTERWAYERGTHRLAVATDPAGAIMGFTYVGPAASAHTGELYAIHVHPDHQRAGVGRRLMAAALRTLVRQELPRAVLWVLTANARARTFYERGGWVCDGVERDAPIGPALIRQVRYSRRLTG